MKKRDRDIAVKSSVLTRLEKDVAKSTGYTADEIRSLPLCELRRRIEKSKGTLTEIKSLFPIIECGNVYGDRLISREQINDEVDAILGE